jgi:hypothetical protein
MKPRLDLNSQSSCLSLLSGGIHNFVTTVGFHNYFIMVSEYTQYGFSFLKTINVYLVTQDKVYLDK